MIGSYISAEGKAADLVLFDPDRIASKRPYYVNDLPLILLIPLGMLIFKENYSVLNIGGAVLCTIGIWMLRAG